MPQCVSEMVQVSNFYLQRGAAKILNKALLKFGRKPIMIYGIIFLYCCNIEYILNSAWPVFDPDILL